MWQALEERLAATDDRRHRTMLEVVIEHAKAEADRSVERLMATLGEDSYTTMDPTAFERIDDAELPGVYLEHLAEISDTSTPAAAAR